MDVASSIQFPPHYTFSIFFTIQLKKDVIFLLVDLSSVVFFGLSSTALILLQEFSGLSRKVFTTWGDFSRSLSALQDTVACAMVKDSMQPLHKQSDDQK